MLNADITIDSPALQLLLNKYLDSFGEFEMFAAFCSPGNVQNNEDKSSSDNLHLRVVRLPDQEDIACVQKKHLQVICLAAPADTKPVLKIRAFGRLDIQVQGASVHFSSAKSRELLALLIDAQGRMMTMDEVIDVLWPERPLDDRVKRLYRKALESLRKTLAQHDALRVLETHRAHCRVIPQYIDCDYFNYTNGSMTPDAPPSEYMIEYSWAEKTLARLLFDRRRAVPGRS